MTLHERLKTERERLGLSQTLLAEMLGVGKTTVINWEKGSSAPDAVQLATLASAGGDVLYVVIGVRSQPMAPAAELPPRVRALVSNYQAAPEAGKRIIEGTASLAAESAARGKHKAA